MFACYILLYAQVTVTAGVVCWCPPNCVKACYFQSMIIFALNYVCPVTSYQADNSLLNC